MLSGDNTHVYWRTVLTVWVFVVDESLRHQAEWPSTVLYCWQHTPSFICSGSRTMTVIKPYRWTPRCCTVVGGDFTHWQWSSSNTELANKHRVWANAASCRHSAILQWEWRENVPRPHSREEATRSQVFAMIHSVDNDVMDSGHRDWDSESRSATQPDNVGQSDQRFKLSWQPGKQCTRSTAQCVFHAFWRLNAKPL